jgi:hypothetical protein
MTWSWDLRASVGPALVVEVLLKTLDRAVDRARATERLSLILNEFERHDLNRLIDATSLDDLTRFFETHVAGFQRFRIFEEAVTHLHGPIAVGREPQSCRPRVPWVRFEVVAVLVGFTTVEDRTFEFEPAIRESSRYYAETDVTRILQVMRQRC